MEPNTEEHAQQVALFRYGLIAELVHPAPEDSDKTLADRLQAKAKGSYCIPGSRRTRVAAETLRDWIKKYRVGGFDALRPAPRKDTGSSRHISQEVRDLLVSLKDAHRDWTVPLVIAAAKKESEAAAAVALPSSTVHRLLSRAGVMERATESPSAKDRRHFQYANAGELWMSDVMHGPQVFTAGRRKQKTYLIALIDDATRVVPYGTFALSEGTNAYLPVLKQAILRRGIPKRLYVDNGSAFRSHHLSLVCARLGITLIHARPYQPQGKGKMERFFRTVRMCFLPTLAEGDLGSLDALNARTWAWVEGEYHRSQHRGLEGNTPMDEWAMRAGEVRIPGPELDLRELFLFEQKRRVHKDRTVSLKGRLYEVAAELVGETVSLRFDPSKGEGPVDVWHRGKKVETARVVNAYANCFVKRHNTTKEIEPSCGPDAPAPALRMRDLESTKKGNT